VSNEGSRGRAVRVDSVGKLVGEFGGGFANRALGESRLLYLSRHTECGEAARAPSPHPCLMFGTCSRGQPSHGARDEGVGGREGED